MLKSQDQLCFFSFCVLQSPRVGTPVGFTVAVVACFRARAAFCLFPIVPLKQLCWQMSPREAESRTEQSRTSAIMLLSACVRAGQGKAEWSLLSQASHYVGCNLSFSRPGPVLPIALNGARAPAPAAFSCAFTLLSSATLIINGEGGGRGGAEAGGGGEGGGGKGQGAGGRGVLDRF